MIDKILCYLGLHRWSHWMLKHNGLYVRVCGAKDCHAVAYHHN